MPRGLLSRSRLLSGWACFVGAVLVAGCTTATPAVTVSGKTLTVYLSAPAGLSGDPQAQDVVRAQELAFSQLKGQVQGFTLRLRVLTGNKISDNARAAIKDSSSVAYLGEVQPGRSVDSLGITNAQDLLQVSPTAAPSVPTKDFESFSTYQRTFASIAPGSDASTLAGGSAGKIFARDFRAANGGAPSSQAILGYVAMAAVIKALQNARSAANNRGTVRDQFFRLRKVPLSIGASTLGSITVNPQGTITITP